MEANFKLNEAVQEHLAANPKIHPDDLVAFARTKAKELGSTTCPYELVGDLLACEE